MITQRVFLATTRPAILAILAATICPLASAQILEEVIVTAQKRAQSINDVPVAISAFSQQQMELANTHDVTSLIAYAPGVSGSSSGVASNGWRIRGIGTNDWSVSSEPAVGVYLDDAYVGRNITATTSFFDVERIEVIKGPQGTLFGRNDPCSRTSFVDRPQVAFLSIAHHPDHK